MSEIGEKAGWGRRWIWAIREHRQDKRACCGLGPSLKCPTASTARQEPCSYFPSCLCSLTCAEFRPDLEDVMLAVKQAGILSSTVEKGSLTSLDITNYDKLAGHRTSGILLSYHLIAKILMHQAWLFMWGNSGSELRFSKQHV